MSLPSPDASHPSVNQQVNSRTSSILPPVQNEAARPLVEPPVPASSISVDPKKSADWIVAEADPALQEVRRELVDSIRLVPFSEFNSRLQTVAANLVNNLQPAGERYAVLWDYKPHSSKRWVTELSNNTLAEYPPTATSYFSTTREVALGLPTITSMVDQGINTFVILDDAIYSGEQAKNKIIVPLMNLFKSEAFQNGHPNQRPKIVIATPYISNRFLTDPYIQQLQAEGVLEITGGYEQMDTLATSLSSTSLDTIQRYGGRITSDPDEDPFYCPPAYAFDHRVPDGHSFPDELRPLIVGMPIKPYDNAATVYYQIDQQDFVSYDEPVRIAREELRAATLYLTP